MKYTLILLFALTVIFVGRPAGAQTNHYFNEFGVGPRDQAMGRAFTAVADNYAAAYYNPAGSARIKGNSITFGYQFMLPRANIDFPGGLPRNFNDRKKRNLPFQAVPQDFRQDVVPYSTIYPADDSLPRNDHALIGITSDLNIPTLIDPKHTERVSFAFVLAVPLPNAAGGETYGNEPFYAPVMGDPTRRRKPEGEQIVAMIPTVPYFLQDGSTRSLLPAVNSTAFRITDWLSVGYGIMLVPQDAVSDAVAMSLTEASPLLPGFQRRTTVTQGVSVQAKWAVRPSGGILFSPPFWGLQDNVNLGVTWRHQMRTINGMGKAQSHNFLDLFGPFTAIAVQAPPVVVADIFNGAGFSPQTWAFGIAVRPTENFLIAIDRVWEQWSQFQMFHTDEDFLDSLKAFQIPGQDFDDRWVTRAGVEYLMRNQFLRDLHIGTLAIRAGANWEPSPLDTLNGITNIIDLDRLGITGGLGFQVVDLLPFKHPVDFDFSFQYIKLLRRSTSNNMAFLLADHGLDGPITDGDGGCLPGGFFACNELTNVPLHSDYSYPFSAEGFLAQASFSMTLHW